MACSPLELAWLDPEDTVVTHAPHLMVRLQDGTGMLIDCSGSAGIPQRLVANAPRLAEAAQAAGWGYRIARPPEPVVAANVRWLSGYRHPRNGGSGRMEEVAACFDRPRPLIEGVRQLGDPIAVWPAVFHALWAGLLRVEMDRPLHERVVAVAASAGEVAA